MERDAPPFQDRYALGVEKGLPWILELLDKTGVKATFFVVASLLEEYPWIGEEITRRGHELASHGYTHRRMDRIDRDEAKREISKSIDVLSSFQRVESFRAPNLQPPRLSAGDLYSLGIRVDSSYAAYKKGHPKKPLWDNGILILPATHTSSIIRMPRVLVEKTIIRSTKGVKVLFYHPWEFTRIRRKPLYRPDIWMRTGAYARSMLSYLIEEASKNHSFMLVREAPGLYERYPSRV